MVSGGELKAAVEIEGVAVPVRGSRYVRHRRLGGLVDEPVGRIEGGGGALRHIGDARAAQAPPGVLAGGGQIHAVEHDRAAANAAAGPGKAHGGQAEGGLAGARFSDQPHDLAAPQGQVDALDDVMPGIVAKPSIEVLDLQQDLALAVGLRWRLQCSSRNPLVLCRNQSTTKFTAMVNSAMAPAGSSGVRLP